MKKIFTKIKSFFSRKKDKKAVKRFTKEKYIKMFKICIFSFLMFSFIGAFGSSFLIGIGLILSLILLILVIRRAPLPDRNIYLYCSKESEMLDISFFPEANRQQMINVYSGFIEYFKNNNIPIPTIDNTDIFEWELVTNSESEGVEQCDESEN